MKNISLTLKDEKLKTEEKIVKIGNQADSALLMKDEFDQNISKLQQAQTGIEKTSKSSEENLKLFVTDLKNLKSEVSSTKLCAEKCTRTADENGVKLFDCLHDCESLKESLDKLKKTVDRRPAAEDLDKKSELTNKLHNDLIIKIEDVDSNLKREVRKTRTDIEKYNQDLKRMQSKLEETTDVSAKELIAIKEDVNRVKSNSDLKSLTKDILTLKTDCDKTVKDVKTVSANIDDISKDVAAMKLASSNNASAVEKIQNLEKNFEVMRNEKPLEKFTSIEKDISSLRADHEKLGKDLKATSTEVKYVDSSLKKDSANTKSEISTFSKSLKEFEKDMNTIHNMVEVLNDEKSSSVKAHDVSEIKNDITKLSSQMTKKINADVKDIDVKINKIQDELEMKITSFDKKMDGSVKGIDSSEVTKKIQKSKDEVVNHCDNKILKCKEELVLQLGACESKAQLLKTKQELSANIEKCSNDIKSVEKKTDSAAVELRKVGELNLKVNKYEDSISNLQKAVDTLDISNKKSKYNLF